MVNFAIMPVTEATFTLEEMITLGCHTPERRNAKANIFDNVSCCAEQPPEDRLCTYEMDKEKEVCADKHTEFNHGTIVCSAKDTQNDVNNMYSLAPESEHCDGAWTKQRRNAMAYIFENVSGCDLQVLETYKQGGFMSCHRNDIATH